jgi:hypothetical protein
VARRIRYDAWAPDPGPGWTTPWCEPGFAFEDLVASWSAVTPRDTWLEVSAQARDDATWHTLGHWTSGPGARRRTSVAGDPEVDIDVWRPRNGTSAYRLRLRFHGSNAGRARVNALGAVVSAGPARATTSTPLRSKARVLDVPRLSQMTYADVGGGEWCSPTAVSMVLAHAGALPPATDVPAAAAEVVDAAFGAGNWSFNTAWAAGLAGNAFVTRLRDLRDAERFIDAGVALVASVAYPSGSLRGAPTHGTEGHLIVIRGFTATGDVVTNDPGAPTDRSVRRTYDRGQLERAWLQGSGGLVYVIHRDDQALPRGPFSGAAS